MIDVENDVFTIVASALRTAHSGIYVVGEYVPAPSSFPAVSIIEEDNRVADRYMTDSVERAVLVMYEAQIFSNKVSGKKAEAKAIANTLDTAFTGLGFKRTMKDPVPNMNDATIYRIVCRYEAVIIPNDDSKFYVHTN